MTDLPPPPDDVALPPVVRSPWTADQVASLDAYQRDGRWHEYTCGDCGRTLVPTAAGWTCTADDYTQRWAHEFTTNWRWRGDGL